MVYNLTEMARIGYLPVGTTGDIEVLVHTNDSGNIPHFHIRSCDRSWETCIKYEEPGYFLHGKYKDKLPGKLRKALMNFFNTDNPKDPGRTYWQTAVIAWNLNNSEVELSYDCQLPNYLLLK